MKKILFFLTVLVSFNSFAQETPTGQPTGMFPFSKPQNSRGTQMNGIQVQSELYIAYRDTDFVAARPGALVKRPADSTNSTVYASYKNGWVAISGIISYPTLQQVVNRDSTVNGQIIFTLTRTTSGLKFNPTLPSPFDVKAIEFNGATSSDETTLPYKLSAYLTQQGAFYSGVQAVFSNKRIDVTGTIQDVQGFTGEPSHVGISTDVNGPGLAIEAAGTNAAGNNESALAIYDRLDQWGGSTPYSLGYGKKKFAMSGIGGMYWGTNLDSNFRANALSSLKVTGGTFRLNDNLDIGVDGTNASFGVVNASGNMFLDAAITGIAGLEWHKASKKLYFPGSTSGSVSIKAVSGTWEMSLPTTDGNNGQVLKTDGNGVTEWVDQSGGGSQGLQSVITNDNRLTKNDTINAALNNLTIDSLKHLSFTGYDADNEELARFGFDHGGAGTYMTNTAYGKLASFALANGSALLSTGNSYINSTPSDMAFAVGGNALHTWGSGLIHTYSTWDTAKINFQADTVKLSGIVTKIQARDSITLIPNVNLGATVNSFISYQNDTTRNKPMTIDVVSGKLTKTYWGNIPSGGSSPFDIVTGGINLSGGQLLGVGNATPYYPVDIMITSNGGGINTAGEGDAMLALTGASFGVGTSSTAGSTLFMSTSTNKDILFGGWNGATNAERIRFPSTGGIKITNKTLLVTPVNGMLEYDGTNLYFTIGSTRTLIL